MKAIALNWLPFDQHPTGAKRRAIELHRRLDHRPFVALVTESFPESDRIELPHVTFIDVAPTRNRTVRWKEGRDDFWSEHLRRHDIAAVMTDTLPVAGPPGRPRIFTVHDLRWLASRRYMKPLRYLLHRRHMGSSLKKTDHVVAVSAFTRDQLITRLSVSPERVSIVPNGTDPISERATPADHPRPYLLSVGHLEPRKNQVTLVEAVAALPETWQGDLVLVGRDLGEGARLRARASSLGVSDRIRFAGSVSDAELASLYAGAEVVVCPSRYEGFGLTILEAFAHGCPVLASEIPPHVEVGGDAMAQFAADGGGAELAQALAPLLGSSTRREELAQRGVERLNRWSWAGAADALDGVYEAVTS